MWTEHHDSEDVYFLTGFYFLGINIPVIQFAFEYNLHDQVYSLGVSLFYYLSDPLRTRMFD